MHICKLFKLFCMHVQFLNSRALKIYWHTCQFMNPWTFILILKSYACMCKCIFWINAHPETSCPYICMDIHVHCLKLICMDAHLHDVCKYMHILKIRVHNRDSCTCMQILKILVHPKNLLVCLHNLQIQEHACTFWKFMYMHLQI